MLRSGFIGGDVGYYLLRWLGRHATAPDYHSDPGYAGASKLETLFHKDIWDEVKDKVVIDYGCGHGREAVELAQHGARKVIGIDTWDHALRWSRETAANAGVAPPLCEFTTAEHGISETADVIFSLDAFEHYENPAAILTHMRSLLKPGGRIFICFGPPWLHPHGGHLFSIFPWSHLLFTEGAQIRWRADFKTDGATRFEEVAGGLNLMTIRRFRQLVEASEFTIERFEPVPIRRLRWLHNGLTREFTTAVLRCVLVNDKA